MFKLKLKKIKIKKKKMDFFYYKINELFNIKINFIINIIYSLINQNSNVKFRVNN